MAPILYRYIYILCMHILCVKTWRRWGKKGTNFVTKYSLRVYLMCYDVQEVGDEGTNFVTTYFMHYASQCRYGGK